MKIVALVNISKPKTDPNLLSLLSDCMGNYTKNLGSWKNMKYKNTTNFVSIEDKNSPVFLLKMANLESAFQLEICFMPKQIPAN